MYPFSPQHERALYEVTRTLDGLYLRADAFLFLHKRGEHVYIISVSSEKCALYKKAGTIDEVAKRLKKFGVRRSGLISIKSFPTNMVDAKAAAQIFSQWIQAIGKSP